MPSLAETVDTYQRYITQLEAENAALKKKITELQQKEYPEEQPEPITPEEKEEKDKW